MNLKGQGALEYLLLIGGAVLVAAIVIALITGIPTTVTNPTVATVCASQFNCNDCVIKDITGPPVYTDMCKAQFTDNTTANDAAGCTAAASKVFKACVPD